MTGRPSQPASLLSIAAGFVLWASAFATLYAAQAVGCAMQATIASHRAVMLGIWAVHIAALVALLVYCRRNSRATDDDVEGFTRRIAFWSSLAALVATVWMGLMIPLVTPCL